MNRPGGLYTGQKGGPWDQFLGSLRIFRINLHTIPIHYQSYRTIPNHWGSSLLRVQYKDIHHLVFENYRFGVVLFE